MTYCVALRLDAGLVFMSDSRTNAGVDDVATVKKMHSWSVPGERVITLMTAGNLATTQSVISLLQERLMTPAERDPSILKAPTLFQVARLVGETLREVIRANVQPGDSEDSSFNATLILGGQIAGMSPRLFLIYPEGNFIEAEADTPFFQIGETKYGRPILVRARDRAMSFEDAIKLLFVSFDSTIAANVSVGLPIDLQVYAADSFEPGPSRRIEADDAYFQAISTGWGAAMKRALNALPDFSFPSD